MDTRSSAIRLQTSVTHSVASAISLLRGCKAPPGAPGG
ncbi:hypothetical protein M2322_004148 [Rhodoblastus acidophilus]|nr:hypothetical protein [Rhodoblastus acidophilus]